LEKLTPTTTLVEAAMIVLKRLLTRVARQASNYAEDCFGRASVRVQAELMFVCRLIECLERRMIPKTVGRNQASYTQLLLDKKLVSGLNCPKVSERR
jgi:hypothetical protein